jgi:hypothetical protein
MNSTIILSSADSALKLTRPSTEKWAATLAEERRRLLEDHEALREREENLRNYEKRLRALQEEIVASRSTPASATAGSTPPHAARVTTRIPFGDETALMAAWEKLHRAREILEAEQSHVREDRHLIREQAAAVKRREAAVIAREEQLTEREARAIELLTSSGEPVADEHTMSAVTRLTRAPFDLARSVFGGKR